VSNKRQELHNIRLHIYKHKTPQEEGL